MLLGGTEHQSLLTLIDLTHEVFDTKRLTLRDDDGTVESLFTVMRSLFRHPLNHRILTGIGVVIHRGDDLLHLKRGKITIIDPLFQRVDVNRFAEVVVGINIPFSFRRCRQPQLNGGLKIFKNEPPAALIVGTSTVTLINDDKVKEVGRVVSKAGRRLSVLISA